MKNETGKLNNILEDSYMKVYTTDKIRNVVILGHGSCGKTTLVEAMAYLGGLTSRLAPSAIFPRRSRSVKFPFILR